MPLKSKFVSFYEKFFQGQLPEQIVPGNAQQFWSDIFCLDIDQAFLSGKLSSMRKDECLGNLKPVLSSLFGAALTFFRKSSYTDPRKQNALETLVLESHAVLNKNFVGWEIMEVLAGGVGASDAVFTELVAVIDDILRNDEAPVPLVHRTLQLALIFVCGINQLSPGAYFLRRDLFPTLVSMILSPKTQPFTFESTLLLSLLSNFHRRDAANLNPYLKHIRESRDEDLMGKICWIVAFAGETAVKAYQEIEDDSPPSLVGSLGTFASSLRPDRVFSTAPAETPRELFKHQPIEAAVILLPLHDFLHSNSLFRRQFTSHSASRTLITLSSYILTHASSTSSPRAMAYAQLVLGILEVIVEDSSITGSLTAELEGNSGLRLCRQRLPPLPLFPSTSPSILAILDCSILWIRHNLQKRLEVNSYIICIRVIYRVILSLKKERARLVYHWEELWRALILLLDFLSNKTDDLRNVARVEELTEMTVVLIGFIVTAEADFLPNSQAVHQLVYELARSSSIFSKQHSLIPNALSPLSPSAPSTPSSKRLVSLTSQSTRALNNLEAVIKFYEQVITNSRARSAKDVVKSIGKEIEKGGVHVPPGGWGDLNLADGGDRSDIGFVRWACLDGMALMPVAD